MSHMKKVFPDKVAEVIIFFWLMFFFLVMLLLSRSSFINLFCVLIFLNKERRPEVEDHS